MTAAGNIAKIIPTAMALVLTAENTKALKKKKMNTKDMTSLGVKNIVGVSLLGVTAGIAGGIK